MAAVDLGFRFVAVPRADNGVRILDVALSESAEFPLSADVEPRDGHWSLYPMTVARRVARNFPGPLQGMDLAMISDLPAAAGMSSSSALMITTFLALSAINQLSDRTLYRENIHDDLDLAGYLGTVENGQSFRGLVGERGVGTFGGSQDHTAILCARPGVLCQFSYAPVRAERAVSFPDAYCFVIADSGVVAAKTGAALELYNRAALRAGAAMELWRAETGREDAHFAAVLDCVPDAAQQMSAILRTRQHPRFTVEELVSRFNQFVAESEHIVPAVPDSLDADALTRFGELVDRSQQLATTKLGNQVPETVYLAENARRLSAVAASSFGAGFGGGVWAMVAIAGARDFATNWSDRYAAAFPQRAAAAKFFATRPGPGAMLM